jgi:hypothetical protein
LEANRQIEQKLFDARKILENPECQ